MNQETDPGHNVQPGRIIEAINMAQPSYFSEKIGRDFGSPMGGWSPEREDATVMTEARAQQLLDGPLATFAANARVVLA